MPADLSDEMEISHVELMEAVAEVDDELIEKYLESGELTKEEFSHGLKEGIQKGQLIPVLCGSSLQNIGVDLLLQVTVKYLPSPENRVPVMATKVKDDGVVTLSANDPNSALVFKTVAGSYSGKLTLFRTFSGAIKGDFSIYNTTQEISERVGQLYMLQGKKQIAVSEVSAGDIGTVAKLKQTVTGDSFSDADEEKISHALQRLTEEDRTLCRKGY